MEETEEEEPDTKRNANNMTKDTLIQSPATTNTARNKTDVPNERRISSQNAQALSVSVGNNYSEDQLMHTFLDKFHQGGKYSAQIASHQVELGREETFTCQKSLSISSLQTDYLNLYSSSGYGRNSERANTVHTKSTFCGVVNHYVENVPKVSDSKTKTFVRMVIRTTKTQNVNLGTFLDVDLKIN